MLGSGPAPVPSAAVVAVEDPAGRDPGVMTDHAPTQPSPEIRDLYTARINALVELGREDLIAELTAEYTALVVDVRAAA
jgi:hypothetical protein